MATYLRISNVNHDLLWSEVSMLVVKWSPTHFISLYAVVKLKIIIGTNPMRETEGMKVVQAKNCLGSNNQAPRI